MQNSGNFFINISIPQLQRISSDYAYDLMHNPNKKNDTNSLFIIILILLA